MKGRYGAIGNKTSVPGPGAYNVSLNYKRESPKFGFGSSTRKPNKTTNQQTPGPGAYKINVKVAETAQYALPNKPETYKYV